MVTVESGSTAEPRRQRVLVIDDSPEGRRALARYLDLQGYEVQEYSDGTSAILSLQAEPAPDIILTDMILPDMDGREIGRKATLLRPRPFVVLLTGWVFDHSPEELEEWGIDLLFFKPVNIKDLLERLQELRKPPSESQSA